MRRFVLDLVSVVAVESSIKLQVNYMHRMTARVVFVLLWVHSGLRVCVSSMAHLSFGYPDHPRSSKRQ